MCDKQQYAVCTVIVWALPQATLPHVRELPADLLPLLQGHEGGGCDRLESNYTSLLQMLKTAFASLPQSRIPDYVRMCTRFSRKGSGFCLTSD